MMVTFVHSKELDISFPHTFQTSLKQFFETSGVVVRRGGGFGCITVLWLPVFYAMKNRTEDARSCNAILHSVLQLRRDSILSKKATYIDEKPPVFSVDITTVIISTASAIIYRLNTSKTWFLYTLSVARDNFDMDDPKVFSSVGRAIGNMWQPPTERFEKKWFASARVITIHQCSAKKVALAINTATKNWELSGNSMI